MSKTIQFLPVNTVDSRQNRFSRFSNHPIYVDAVTKNKFIGKWTPKSFPLSELDRTFQVSAAFEFRPDAISFLFYETPLLAWVICYVNDILNPLDRETGLYSGRVIRIPDISIIVTTLGF